MAGSRKGVVLQLEGLGVKMEELWKYSTEAISNEFIWHSWRNEKHVLVWKSYEFSVLWVQKNKIFSDLTSYFHESENNSKLISVNYVWNRVCDVDERLAFFISLETSFDR